MGKRRKTKAIIKVEFDLPEPIIQHIQSFLTGKEAAQTTILSKSWRDAWLTRPNLSFDEGDFHTQLLVVDKHSSNFSSYYFDSSSDSSDYSSASSDSSGDSSDSSSDSSDSSSDSSDSSSDSSSDRDDRRGDDSKKDEFLNFAKMTIQRYEQSNLKIETLRLRIFSSFWRSNGSNDAHDLIVRALKIGVTHLSLQVDYKFVLPREVFQSGNLVELSMEGGEIDLKMDQKVIFPKLESLSLSNLKIKREMISKIISNCPSIKKLSLARIWGSGYKSVRLIKLPKSQELIRCLVLYRVKLDILFLADLSSKLPSLEDLTLDSCRNVREICSCSLMRLTLIAQGDMKVKFDVPRIQKFTFEGPDFPSISFETTSREWESHVSINYKYSLCTLWFSGLERILTGLRRSKIHLSLSLYPCSTESLNYEPEDIHGLSKCQVENVRVDLFKLPSSICRALFAGLFRLCRPKFVTHILYPENTSTCEITNNNFLCKKLVRGINGKFLSRRNFMHGLHGLDNVNMELYDEDVAVWRLVPLASLFFGSMSPKEKQNVRFQLIWKP